MKKKKTIDIEALLRGVDFPHTRKNKGKWLQTGPAPKLEPGFSFQRLCHYASQLRDLGMADSDIVCMLSDLYWDAFSEFKLNNTYAQYDHA